MAKNIEEATDNLPLGEENTDTVITGIELGVNDVTGVTVVGVAPVTVKLSGVRILTDCNLSGVVYRCGQFAEIDCTLIDALVANGVVDDSPEAVDYAKSQQ